jgi:phenylalanyl-tRNA synthetase beta chain
MNLAIRSEAAVLNEKGVDPELADKAVMHGVELLEKIADAKVISEFLDIYPNKVKPKTVSVTFEKIDSVIGVPIEHKTSVQILKDLGFEVSSNETKIDAIVPSWRANDIEIPEDLVEEIARVYGYFKIPSIIPPVTGMHAYNRQSDLFYWENRARTALKHWGFSELYTYPMVSEDLLEVATKEAVTIKNPLTEDHIYMRTTLVPSLLSAIRENKNRSGLKLFELANVYLKRDKKLPEEKLKLAGIYKREKADFFEVKGVIESLLLDLGVKEFEFKPSGSGGTGADVYIAKSYLGQIEILEPGLIDFELDFETIVQNTSLKKSYAPVSKFPESVEDLRFEIDETIPYGKIVRTIREQSDLVKKIELLDVYKNKKTFRIIYQSSNRNLTNEDLTQLREKITSALKKSFKANPS